MRVFPKALAALLKGLREQAREDPYATVEFMTKGTWSRQSSSGVDVGVEAEIPPGLLDGIKAGVDVGLAIAARTLKAGEYIVLVRRPGRPVGQLDDVKPGGPDGAADNGPPGRD